MTFPHISKNHLAVLFFFITISCSRYPDKVTEVNTSDLPQLEIEYLFTLSSPEDLFLQRISSIKSDSEGRIYLLDEQALQIHVYDSNGEYLTSIGREGSGPGEFQSLLQIYLGPKDQLFTFDIRQARNTIFAEHSNSWEVDKTYMIEGHRYGIVSADSDGNVILRQSPPQYPEPGIYWYEHELATGSLSSGLYQQNVLSIKEMGNLVLGNGFMNQIPFGRTTNVATDPEGNLYLVWNEQFELAIYNSQLEWLDSLNVPIPNQPISLVERTAAIDRLADNFRSLGREYIPHSKPVISDIFVDENRNIWLHTFDTPEFLVLNREGTPLRSFDLDDDLRLFHVDHKRLYTLKLDSEGYQVQVFEYHL